MVLIDREVGRRGPGQFDLPPEEARQLGIDVGRVAEHRSAVSQRDANRRKPAAVWRFDQRGPTAEQPRPQLRVLGADHLPGRHVNQGVGTIPGDATLGDVGFVHRLAQHRLDRKPPQRRHRAYHLVHGSPPRTRLLRPQPVTFRFTVYTPDLAHVAQRQPTRQPECAPYCGPADFLPERTDGRVAQ